MIIVYMSCNINKEEILENLMHEEYESVIEQGFIGEQALILAAEQAKYRYENGLYGLSDYCD